MKVILVKDVAKIGRRGEVVNVPDGFALNKLIPRGMAKTATPQNLKLLQNESLVHDKERVHEAAQFADVVAAVKETVVSLEVETNKEGKMFEGLKAQAVSDAIKKAVGKHIDASQIVIEEPIKSVGEHSVALVSGPLKEVITITIISKSK